MLKRKRRKSNRREGSGDEESREGRREKDENETDETRQRRRMEVKLGEDEKSMNEEKNFETDLLKEKELRSIFRRQNLGQYVHPDCKTRLPNIRRESGQI